MRWTSYSLGEVNPELPLCPPPARCSSFTSLSSFSVAFSSPPAAPRAAFLPALSSSVAMSIFSGKSCVEVVELARVLG